MQNSRRYDLSDRLIHFFRKIDLDIDGIACDTGPWNSGNFCEDTKYSAMFLLRCAIRSGDLWATWSTRGGVRTIYGPKPAVCFTDMPTAAFLETAKQRQAAGEKISSIALTFPKNKMFELGARPVIYSLSDRSIPMPKGDKESGERTFPPDVLPIREQYRYVTYSPVGDYRVEWTHEREWRWPLEVTIPFGDEATTGFGPNETMQMYRLGIKSIGVIVNSRVEADRVIHDVLRLVDCGVVSPDTYSYVLVGDEVGEPASIRSREDEEAAISKASIDLNKYLVTDAVEDEKIRERVSEIATEVERAAVEPETGEFGGCWLWLVDNTHRVTRAFVNCKEPEDRDIVINGSGKYLIPLREFSDSRGLKNREEMTEELAKRLKSEFGIEAGYFSVLGRDDPNELPSFNTDFLDERMHYNFATDGL